MNNSYCNFSRDNFYDIFHNVLYKSSSFQPDSYEYLLLHNIDYVKTQSEDTERDDKVWSEEANYYENYN